MTPRLASGLVINALVRRTAAAGGIATVLAKGDPDAGAILLVTTLRGVGERAWERGHDPDGKPALVVVGPNDSNEVAAYWARRRLHDRDLWVLELDIANGERFAAQTLLDD